MLFFSCLWAKIIMNKLKVAILMGGKYCSGYFSLTSFITKQTLVMIGIYLLNS